MPRCIPPVLVYDSAVSGRILGQSIDSEWVGVASEWADLASVACAINMFHPNQHAIKDSSHDARALVKRARGSDEEGRVVLRRKRRRPKQCGARAAARASKKASGEATRANEAVYVYSCRLWVDSVSLPEWLRGQT